MKCNRKVFKNAFCQQLNLPFILCSFGSLLKYYSELYPCKQTVSNDEFISEYKLTVSLTISESVRMLTVYTDYQNTKSLFMHGFNGKAVLPCLQMELIWRIIKVMSQCHTFHPFLRRLMSSWCQKFRFMHKKAKLLISL